MDLNFVLDGQTLKKAKNFPLVVEKSKDFLRIVVDGIPSGYNAVAYFRPSWESGKTYDLVMVGNSVVIDEYLTTLPENPNEYVDYVLGVSLAGVNAGGNRFTTNIVDIVLDKTAFSTETENTPEVPKSQIEEILEKIPEMIDVSKEIVRLPKKDATYETLKNLVDGGKYVVLYDEVDGGTVFYELTNSFEENAFAFGRQSGQEYQTVIYQADGNVYTRVNVFLSQGQVQSEYDPTSDMPVNGLAVAQAVEEAVANLSGGGIEWETLASGELTEGGVALIAEPIPVNLAEYKRLQIYVEAKHNALETQASVHCQAKITNISEPAAYTTMLVYQSVNHKDAATFRWLVQIEIFDISDERVMFHSLFNISKYTGNNSAGGVQGMFTGAKKTDLARTDWAAPHLKLSVTNTTFEAGTKFYLKGCK